MANTVVIVIISHKEKLTASELLSIKQCYKVLGHYPIRIVTPLGNDISFYEENLKQPRIDFVDSKWLNSYSNFNKFKCSKFLYKKYSKYKFILFYEPDAYVFSDDLSHWCDLGYDYIGAPWSGIHIYNNEPLTGVGNGGFSLRKVKSAIKLLMKLRMLEVLEQYQYFNWKGIIPRLPIILNELIIAKKKPCKFEKEYAFQEDVFWCKSASERLDNFTYQSSLLKILGKLLIRNDFKIAPIEIALKFSFETNPRELFRKNKEQLPFGCHAWEKYEPDFWKSFIPETITSVTAK